jgi:hypothetical protein
MGGSTGAWHRKRYVQAQQWGQGLGVLQRCNFARPQTSSRLQLLSARQDRRYCSAQPLALRQPPAGQALCCPMRCDCRCTCRHFASWSANPVQDLLQRTQPVVFTLTVNCHTVRVRGICGWAVAPCGCVKHRILLWQGVATIPR